MLVVVVVVLGMPVAVVDVVEVVVVRHRFVSAVDAVHMVRVLGVVMPVRVRFAGTHAGHLPPPESEVLRRVFRTVMRSVDELSIIGASSSLVDADTSTGPRVLAMLADGQMARVQRRA